MLKLSFGNSNNVNSLYTSFWSWLIETLISLQNDLKAGNVTVHNPPLLKLEISSGLCVFKFMLSSFPALRMTMACWLSTELTLQYSCAGFATHDHSHIAAQPFDCLSIHGLIACRRFFFEFAIVVSATLVANNAAALREILWWHSMQQFHKN